MLSDTNGLKFFSLLIYLFIYIQIKLTHNIALMLGVQYNLMFVYIVK